MTHDALYLPLVSSPLALWPGLPHLPDLQGSTVPMTDPVENAQAAHRAALAAQQAMREASRERDKAVQAARAAGVPAAELATALGVNRHRIHAMLKTAEQQGDL
jgi:DNA-directed RNA polymerase specialized sigma24 family protein